MMQAEGNSYPDNDLLPSSSDEMHKENASPPPYSESTDGNVQVNNWITQNESVSPPSYSERVQQPQSAGYDQPGLPQTTGSSTRVIVIAQSQIYAYQMQPERSFSFHIVLSCLVIWLCGWMCGLVAYGLAISAREEEKSGKRQEATRQGRASIVFSIIGILVGIACTVFLIIYYYGKSSQHQQTYTYSSSGNNHIVYG
jgi:uncharacterized membrane protein YidH (DUF202 family)